MNRSICPFLIVSLSLVMLTTAMAVAQPPAKSAPLEVGTKAIDFELPVVGGDDYVRLERQYEQGPVVVVVLRGYPGYQCPLCSQQVSALINRAKSLGQWCHRVILVYPGETSQLEKHAGEFIGSRRLPDPLVMVRDDAMEMVTQWGLRWNSLRETAYPATFVISQNGRIVWSKISQSHAGRSSAEEIIVQLRKLKS